MNKIITIVILIIIAAGLGWWTFNYLKSNSLTSVEKDTTDVVVINSFKECEAAGYQVEESVPARCRTSDGQIFTQILPPIVYENASEDDIRVELPYPGAVVGKEFRILGEARGPWFFEGSFSIEVLVPNGDVLAKTYASTEGEWMTTDFVPFISEVIDLPSAYRGEAVLILRKHNASDKRELDASISFPVLVEY